MGLTHSPSITTDGLVLCLDAGNVRSYPKSGTVWSDLSGNGNDGTLINGPTFSSSNCGSLAFDAVNDYVNVGNMGITVQTYTVLGWIYKTTTFVNNGAAIISGGYGGDIDNIIVYSEEYAPTNSIYIAANGATKVYYNGKSVAYPTNFNLNEWLHFSIILTVPSIDGGDHNIGRNNNGSNRFGGLIASILVYSRELSANEIKQNYLATKGRFNL